MVRTLSISVEPTPILHVWDSSALYTFNPRDDRVIQRYSAKNDLDTDGIIAELTRPAAFKTMLFRQREGDLQTSFDQAAYFINCLPLDARKLIASDWEVAEVVSLFGRKKIKLGPETVHVSIIGNAPIAVEISPKIPNSKLRQWAMSWLRRFEGVVP